MMRNKIYLVVSLLLFGGCATGEANRYYLQEKFPARNIKEVQVLNEKPARPYIVMADFQAYRANSETMQKRAAEIGADAVIVTCTGGWYSMGEVWADKDRYSKSCSGLVATAIKYKTE